MGDKTDSAPRPAINNYLIADPSSSRKNVRAVLTELGANSANIHQCGTLGDAKALIQSLKPEVLFVDQEMAGSKLGELVNLQEQVLPPCSSRAFFLISTKASGADASKAAEELIDAVLVKPFTLEELQTQVMAALEVKFFPSPQQKLINAGTSQLKNNWLDEAFQTFQKAVELDSTSPLALSHLGQCLMKMSKPDQALTAFKLGLTKVPTHYRCLLGAVDASSDLKDFDSAYSYARKLAENHPIPLKKIPDFIRLSVLNGKFNDVLEFYKVVDGVSGLDESLSINVSAGLVVCGLLYLKDGKTKEAVDIFKKAELMARGNSKILTRIAVGLVRAKLDVEFGALMSRMPKEAQDAVELQSALVETGRTQDPMLALKTSLEMINARKFDPTFFRVAIEVSIDMKRSASSIAELIDQAVQVYPDTKSDWDAFRSRLEK